MDFIPLCFSFSCPVKLKPDGQQPTQPLLCPHCNNGALVPFKSRRWFEFCFLPIIPFGSDHIWFCNICSWQADRNSFTPIPAPMPFHPPYQPQYRPPY
ncbi:hypothetical protein E3P81_01498 [Wallemia ichthyophaga]|uniref:Zinc-ribbon 15 domain-containing protein n=2 Tax=Wallemia ichthyophaga TaxID=245174 RepID=A0A4T0K795_WALIC|nr:uncharacterized protein J056_000904 [Wallemia ichthyophaga EXF-994]TIA74057.1 hypothetical protein E3P91_01193 [Wallemia ichthyophaga]EOR00366.1 hypothetical protein J056_000904 [Wallemia ichthyophaga EXF-994]TIA82622.1 hypothetical protein E3P98_01333 [Wallemia ichthyophaga]TIA92438.1 hypothetical protein E3P97_01499 [Wallemia ichthyophaga]TIB00122.1 hypothetical protein E3P96_02736 [Wallemia ichthyophaga]